jgi:hypothetical protein
MQQGHRLQGRPHLLFFAIDDFVSFGQNRALNERWEHGEQAAFDIHEYFGPVLLSDGKVGASIGVAGRF